MSKLRGTTDPEFGDGWFSAKGVWLFSAVAIAMLAGALRYEMVDQQSLSMDEYWDLTTARGGWQSILAAEDRFPPLYHSFLNLWITVFPHDSSGRGLSALCGILTVGVVGLFGDAIGGRTTGITAALLSAISPFAMWYSLETRVYALYLLLAAVAMWQWWLALETDQTRHWLSFIAASLLGIYTHYYFALLIALLCLAAFPICWKGRASLARAIRFFALLGVGSLPCLWFLLEDLDQPWGHAQSTTFSVAALGYTYFSFFSGYSLGPSLGELHRLAAAEAVRQVLPWLLLLGIPTAYLFWRGITARYLRWRWLAFVIVLGILPPIVVGLVSLNASFGYNVRHLLWSFVPLILTVSRGVSLGRSNVLVMISLLLVASCFTIGIYNRNYVERYQTEDARAAARHLREAGDADVPLFVLSGYMEHPLQFYLPDDWQVVGLYEVSEDPQNAVEQIHRVASDGKFWLAYTRPFHGDPEGSVLEHLKAAFPLEQQTTVTGIQLWRTR